MIGVVKANAYGSALEVVAQKLVALGIEALAVAYADEGILLRKKGVEKDLKLKRLCIETLVMLTS